MTGRGPNYQDHDHRTGSLINPEGYLFLRVKNDVQYEHSDEEDGMISVNSDAETVDKDEHLSGAENINVEEENHGQDLVVRNVDNVEEEAEINRGVAVTSVANDDDNDLIIQVDGGCEGSDSNPDDDIETDFFKEFDNRRRSNRKRKRINVDEPDQIALNDENGDNGVRKRKRISSTSEEAKGNELEQTTP